MDKRDVPMLGETATAVTFRTEPDPDLPFSVRIFNEQRPAEWYEWAEWESTLSYEGYGMCVRLDMQRRRKSKHEERAGEKETAVRFDAQSLNEVEHLARLMLATVEKMRRTAVRHCLTLETDEPKRLAPLEERAEVVDSDAQFERESVEEGKVYAL